MKLELALAQWITTKISVLHVFKDELAHAAAGYPYPLLLITEIDARRKQFGTGSHDDMIVTDSVSTERKWWGFERTLRFTVRAPADKQQDGNTIVRGICDSIDTELQTLIRSGAFDLPVENDSVHVAMANHAGFHELPAITDKLPFVYQRALSWRFLEVTMQQWNGIPAITKVNFALGATDE